MHCTMYITGPKKPIDLTGENVEFGENDKFDEICNRPASAIPVVKFREICHFPPIRII